MRQYINFNGKFLPAENNIFSVENRAFRYGDGLFETMFATKMRVPLLSKHYNRLLEGMRVLQFEIPASFTFQYLNDLILSLLNRNKHYMGSQVRLQVFRNGDGKYTPSINTFSFIIETAVFDRVKYQINSEKISLGLYDKFQKHPGGLSKFKTASALEFIKAGIWTKNNQYDDCLILNSEKYICEALASNVFIVINDYIATPHTDSGCVDGVMRNQILQIAKENNYKVDIVKRMEEDLLLRSDEILLTNAVSGIKWVMGFRNNRYLFDHANKLTQKLNQKLEI